MPSEPRYLTASFVGRPTALRRGPKMIQQFVGDDASIALTRDAILLTTELLTLATVDADRCQLDASFDGHQLHVEVAEIRAATPICRPGATVRGDALQLVNSIPSRWGAKVNGARAAIWFELERDIYESRLTRVDADRASVPVVDIGRRLVSAPHGLR